MKLLSFLRGGDASYGVLKDGRVIDAKRALGGRYPDLLAVLDAGALGELEQAVAAASESYALDEIRFLPVIPNPRKIFCIGINYRSHADEIAREKPAYPMVFSRFANSQVGHGEPMPLPPESDSFDYEGEIAVIIGRRGRRISQADSWEYIAGYAPYNDGTIRAWQRHTTQWIPGKNWFASGGFGPWMATRDEIDDNANLTLVTRLNGEEMQRAQAHDMLYSIPELIEYCSIFTELEPGDIIVSGTPGGVGWTRKPPVFMKDGDTIEIEISEIGTLVNHVTAEQI